MAKFTPDPAKARAHVEAASKLLEDGIAAITSTAEWRRYLRTQARFHHYSANNALLIMLQRPDATRVAGFEDWRKMGRHVRKGESGIRIFAPLKRVTEREDAVSGETVRVSMLTGFRSVPVFDITQTDGPELPAAPACQMIETATDAGAALFDLLMRYCAAEQIPVSIEPLRGTRNGEYRILTRSIALDPGLAPDMSAKTLLHEIAHSRLHATGVENVRQGEVEAEATAFVVCSALGLDTASYTLPYVAKWQGDSKALMTSAATIQKTAHAILSRLAEIGAAERQEVVA